MPLACPREPRLVLDVGVELARGAPERAERSLPAAVIPDAGCDDAVSPGDARELAQPGDRICHEVDDELRQGGIERGVLERELLRRRAADVDPGVALPGGGDERLRGIHGRDRLGAQLAPPARR